MVDIDRRTLLATSAAVAAAGAAEAAEEIVDIKIDPKNLTPEQKKLLGIRFRTLDGESHQNFIAGMKRYNGSLSGRPEFTRDLDAFLKTKGTSLLDDTTLDAEGAWKLLMEHQPSAARLRLAAATQTLMWDDGVRDLMPDRKDLFALLDEYETKGPGKLELNPKLDPPKYTRHEIHQQPGGFVGDPLGGWVYHYVVTQGHRGGMGYFDENHISYTQAHEKPKDGKVRRILDIGSGTGQSTTPMKMRFPNAEVWGIEVGGPMVRYAHYRAAKMGIDVNFRHGLAEESGFPDNHFDMVTDHLMFHEVQHQGDEGSSKIVKEIFRVLRPGGVFSHHDGTTAGWPKGGWPAETITARANAWEQLRLNNYEPWYLEYHDSDFPNLLRKTGFKVEFPEGPERILAAYKPA